MEDKQKNYDDIINLPHHVSSTHTQMPIEDRAAQFAPFAALTGYDDAIEESARLTVGKIELDDNEKALLDQKLSQIVDKNQNKTEIKVTYFVEDKLKEGGEYQTITGRFKRIEDDQKRLVFDDDTKILIEDIIKIEDTTKI